MENKWVKKKKTECTVTVIQWPIPGNEKKETRQTGPSTMSKIFIFLPSFFSMKAIYFLSHFLYLSRTHLSLREEGLEKSFSQLIYSFLRSPPTIGISVYIFSFTLLFHLLIDFLSFFLCIDYGDFEDQGRSLQAC